MKINLKLVEKDQTLEQKLREVSKEHSLQKDLLAEVSSHLLSCLSSLKSNEDSMDMVNISSILIPNSIHADNLRQMMRKLEDDIISQMALLTNLKTSLNDSVGASEDAHAQVIASLNVRV